MHMPAELAALDDQLDAIDADARKLVADLDEARAGWRATPDSWSVAECLDHLAVTNRVYLRAMQEPALRARQEGRLRRGPALPGFVGRWFIRTLEPPVKARSKTRTHASIVPRSAPSLADALTSFIASQDEVRAFVRANADLDLASVRFPNPFVRGVRFSLATGLHVIAAHDRRHLWQAWRVRTASEQAAAA